MKEYINDNWDWLSLLLMLFTLVIFITISLKTNFLTWKNNDCNNQYIEKIEKYNIEDYEKFNPLRGNWNLFTRPKE